MENELALKPQEKLVVLVIGTIAGFAANHFTEKGLTKLILSRKS